MKRMYFLCYVLFFGCIAIGSAQITGTVSDEDGPLPGASVVVKGTTTGSTTDFDGLFTINAEVGDKLVISYIGYETKEVTAQSGTMKIQLSSGVALSEVIIVGSRNPNRTATESMVPVDVISMKELNSVAPQVNLNQILNYVAPSFTSNTQTISDGTDHVDPASLRGLGPDQVLVLINGKRRHTSSLINVNGTFGRGSVGTDLNAIPAAAIQRIEVLRDGAAAQYGSDAIAGVINIVLNKSVNELNMSVTSGANFSKNANDQTGGVDGATTNIAASYGVPLGENGGFLNFSGDFDVRQDYSRMKEWEGGIFNAYNSIERLALGENLDIADLQDADVVRLSQNLPYFDQNDRDIINGFSSSELHTPTKKDDDGNIIFYNPLSNDVTDSELTERNQKRSDYNMRVGQSALRGGRIFANFSLPLDDSGTEVYSFAGISSRTGNSAGFYRLPNQSRTYTPAYMNGFLPEINSTIKDRSLSVGVKGKINEWDVDLSNTYGKNSFLYSIGNTFNASMQNASPTLFDAGGFSFAQNTANLDVTRFFEDALSGLNVAFGAEYRVENYDIVAGEPASYGQYDGTGNINNPYDDIVRDAAGVPVLDGEEKTIPNPNSDVRVPTDFFGESRPGGSQVFPGFGPSNELSRGRSSVAGYIDLEADFSEKFVASFATRFENYSDFGSTINFKLATRYKVNDNINLRAAGNTGFRAPSLHQINFNSTSTIFDQNGDPQEVGTFANDSRAAKLLGIPELKEETSSSISVGFTAKIPDANLTLTVDGYYVEINDRVVYTGQFEGPGTGTELDNLLSQANATAASFFANAINTESRGLDVVLTHTANLSDNWRLKSDLAGTLSKTNQIGDINSSKVLEDAGLVNTYFPEDSRVYLEEAVPRTKINLSNSLTSDKWIMFLRNVYFGEVTEATTVIANQQVFGTKVVTDLSIGYKATDALTLTIGANNLLDIYPDRAEDQYNNRSDGRFDWSRRAQQFGIGGRFLFARVSFALK
ncbi:TonB-dependent receptor [Zobellia galactanivorans]|uniref:TonB-dependent receptor n=1 Tax=Zobellia galactanivorans (strain DSM 12802 / CCUG 47099 / CIP 106680 / NCIMB 13871 / Dsij) TaxID=63186 RepID=UPI001C06C867|nr:TonB-dependent receptor [Zobellia galactanivorans]MBU3025456.1 TonB-dependent receptor [Zobellia galactanivorans]